MAALGHTIQEKLLKPATFAFQGKKKRAPGLVAIDFQAEGVCVARIERRDEGAPVVSLCDFRPWDPDQATDRLLAAISKDFDLDDSRCSTVLAEGDYSLLLTEAPDVPAEEMRSAIRWRVKDLVDFPLDNAIIDVFDVPGDKAPSASRSIYAVVAPSDTIKRRSELLIGADMGLEVIDIPEMAQRNLAGLLPEDASGVVMVNIGETGGLITITRNGELYLSRGLGLGLDNLRSAIDATEYFDRIVLEVQRSLDYFESSFRQAPITNLVIAPLAQEVPGLVDYLSANLSLSVSLMNLSDVLEFDVPAPANVQTLCLGAIGAALREDERST